MELFKMSAKNKTKPEMLLGQLDAFCSSTNE